MSDRPSLKVGKTYKFRSWDGKHRGELIAVTRRGTRAILEDAATGELYKVPVTPDCRGEGILGRAK